MVRRRGEFGVEKGAEQMSRVRTCIASYSIDGVYQNLQNMHNDTAETLHFYV